MTEFCVKYPFLCKERDYVVPVPTVRSTGRPQRPLREVPRTRDGRVFNTDYIIELNKRVGKPKLIEQQSLISLRGKLPANLKVGSQEVEHTKESVLNSILAQVAYENAYEGREKAREYLDNSILPELRDFEIIDRFTDNNKITLKKKGTNDIYISFRGSDGDFLSKEANVASLLKGQGSRIKNATDWGTNLYTLKGQEHTTKRYKEAVETAKKVADFFNVPVEELNLTGHSLGGGQADHVAEVLGSKSVSFDPARNPLSNRPVNPKAKIESHSTIFDPVSIGRHIHEHLKGRPSHINHTTYTSALGHEAGWIKQHELEEQFIKPLYERNSKFYSVRSTPLRNTVGMLGSQTEGTIKGLTGAFLPYALTPEYETKGEKAFRTADNYLEAVKMTAGMSDMLYKVNPAFYFIDQPSLISDLMSIDPIVPNEAKVWLKSKLGLKQPAPKYVPPPAIIQKINKALDPITGRYTADQQLERDFKQAEELGMSLENYLQLSYQPKPLTQTKGSLAYSTQEAHEIGQKYHE
jgi:hypothetical protein